MFYFNRELWRTYNVNRKTYGVNRNTLIPTSIPLFTYQNAVEHGNASRNRNCLNFWWDMTTYDYDNRLLFLNWIKQELNKQL